MQITYLGHSGLFIETEAGSILCDPWFNPCYFASWFPFPSNESIDLTAIADPDYLYISHEHHDHFDSRFLREHVNKSAVVLLPEFPVQSLERKLRDLGFRDFVKTRNARPVELEGLSISIVAMTTPSDGPEGDSGLVVDDGRQRIFNQNDSRPTDMEVLRALGPYDAHFVQFSGAIWYPMVYRVPENEKLAFGRRKRANQQARALAFIQQIDAPLVFPSGGPPCFLDDDLFHLNDIHRDPSNIFCDQAAFLDYLRERGENRGRLIVPGSVITLEEGCSTISHPVPHQEIEAIFYDKASYLEAYRTRKAPDIKAIKETWPTGETDIAAAIQARFEPLMATADRISAGINGRVLLDFSSGKVVLDFPLGTVYEWNGEKCKYKFWIAPSLVEACLLNAEEDWVNYLFLSCRFEAQREGPYNEYVYNFFKCLSPERLQYAEGYYAEQVDGNEMFQIGNHMIQRRCPHLKADLARFGRVENGILTCTMHGWQFDLATGRCLTSGQCTLHSRPAVRGDDSGISSVSTALQDEAEHDNH